jgi:ADP-heptose:LPS heptosyltransferase
MIASEDRPVLLLGAPSEREYVEEVRMLVAPDARRFCHNVAGEISIGGLLGLLSGAKALITNDTGPMHMAFALGTPMVCLFGPGSPDHYTIRNGKTITLSKPVYCSPCLYEIDRPPCGGENVCMTLITPDEVHLALSRLLKESPPAVPTEFIYESKGKTLGLLVRESIAE